MKKSLPLILLIIFTSAILITESNCSSQSGADLEPYIKIELNRLEETYRLLGLYAQDIWPGWDNYKDIEVRVTFPNNVEFLVTSKETDSESFVRIPGRTIYGKDIFINKEKEVSMEIMSPLFASRGRGGLLIQLDMDQPELPPEEPERSKNLEAMLKADSDKNAAFNLAPLGDSDTHILMYVHEHFHGFQASFGSRGGQARGLADFQVSPEYAAFSHIEGLALLQAFEQKDYEKALDNLKDFFIAREIKQSSMPPEAVSAERILSVVEGPPSYSSLKMAMLIRDNDYKQGISREDDPYFFNFRYVDGYLENILKKGLHFAANWTLDKRGKYYLYGAYQCFLLDRFVPEWKKDFLKDRKNLDEMMSDFLNISQKEKEEISVRLKTRYSYEDIYKKHERVIKNAAKKKK